MTDLPNPRRGFLQRAAGGLLALVAAPSSAMALSRNAATAPDESWLQGLNGKHRQVFDVAGADGRALGRAGNYMDVYGEAYGLTDSDVNVLFVAHGGAVPLVLNDALWQKYELGKRAAQTDPATGGSALKNPFARDGATSVARLQQRGVRFVVCMRSIRRLSGELAARGNAEAVRTEILQNLLPDVVAVPAAIVAVNRAQESGLTYVYIG